MAWRIILTEQATRDMQATHDWWAEHRSAEEAARWYNSVLDVLPAISRSPLRFPLIAERKAYDEPLRQVTCGVGPGRTHRIIFALRGDTIAILRVRHLARGPLRPGEES